MNIIQLVKEECERISKKGTYLSMEAENIKKRAKEKFLLSQRQPMGTIQFMANDVMPEERKIVGFRENERIINVPYHTTNLVQKLNINVFEGAQSNFKMPMWNNTIYSNDDFRNLPNAIYNTADTLTELDRKTTLDFTAKKYYINVNYSGTVVRAACTSIQDALTEDALKQIYDAVLFEGLKKNAPYGVAPMTATTKTDIITYLDGAKGQHAGIFVMGQKAFQTLLKMGDIIKNNLVLEALPYMVYESRYLPSDALIYFNPEDVKIAQFGGFDMVVDNITDRPKDIIHVHLEGYFDADTMHATNGLLYVAEPSEDVTPSESGDTTPQESGTTEPTEPTESGDTTPTNEGE